MGERPEDVVCIAMNLWLRLPLFQYGRVDLAFMFADNVILAPIACVFKHILRVNDAI